MEDIKLIHGDSLQALKGYADNHFDVAIVDPPYGINIKTRVFDDEKNWDNAIPPKEYFEELKRVSRNQIIWGGNYFVEYLENSSCWIVWDKLDTAINGNWRCELAWTSFDKSSYICKTKIPGERGFFTVDYKRIHPTQKAVDLYKYCLENYTKEGDLILDTHLGSGSIAIACYYMKRKLIGYEIDKDYYDAACKRFKEQTMQQALW